MQDPDDRTLLDELFGTAAEQPDDADDAVGSADSDDAAVRSAPVRPEPVPPPDVPKARGRQVAARTPRPRQRSALPESELPEPGLPGALQADVGAVRQDAAPARRSAAAWRGIMWARSGVRPSTAPGCREIGLTTIGFVIFVTVDGIMMYTPFSTPGSTSLLPQALTLVLLAFGLGALMIWSIRGACRPVGVGMMLGWVFMTLISAGYFTGLNP